MLLADCHVHSSFSSDSDTPVEEMILQGIQQGRKYFYITDHEDLDYPIQEGERDFLIDMDSYFSTMKDLKNKYESQIDIRIGVELGLMAHISDKISSFANAYPFDFIIGSSHLVNGIDPYYPDYYANRTDKEAYREYFESILANIKTFDCFHVYGHLDYVVRYGPTKDQNYHPEDYEELFREILKELIYRGKGIEINTGSLYKGFDFAHPHNPILKWYHELGGEIITVGSDAHVPKYYGYGFDLAEELLKANGFRYYTLFKNGTPEQISLK